MKIRSLWLLAATFATLLVATAHAQSTADIKVIKGPDDLAPTTKPFVHPGIYYNAADLDFMRKKIAAKAEPWNTAWEKQSKPDERDLAWTPKAVVEWDANKDFYMNRDPQTAHKLALAWSLTGDKAAAAKAIEILNAWSSTLQTITKHDMPQERLASGVNMAHMANAAELLVHGSPDGKPSGWTPEDVEKFKKMLRMYVTVIEPFMSGFNGNWDAIMMNSMAASGIFLDEPAMFDRALKQYIVGEKNAGIVNYVYPSGQCQESGRDQGHVQWGLSGLASTCEVAWKQGIDIYGAYDNRLLTGLEYSAKYNLGEDVPFDPGKAKVISAKGRGNFSSVWEAPYQHFTVRRGLEMPYTKQIVEGTNVKKGGKQPSGEYRPEGANSIGIGWGTLTMLKGPEDPQAKK